MSNELLYFGIVLVQNSMIIAYLDTVLDYKYSKWKTNILIFLFLNLLYLATMPIINYKVLKLCIITVLDAMVFKISSNNSWKEVIKKSLILDAIMLLSEIFATPVLFLIFKAHNVRTNIDTADIFDTIRVLSGSFSLPYHMFNFLIYSIYYRKITGIIRKKLIFLLSLVPLVTIFTYYIIFSYNFETFTDTTLWFIYISSVLFTILSVAIYKLIIHIDGYIRKEKELEFLKEKKQMQFAYYNDMLNKELEIRKLNHDLKNNIQVMYSLKKEDEKEKLMMKISEKLSQNEIIKYSKIDILNVILNLKKKEAEKNNIELVIEIRKNIDFMEELDISNLFSNILDNAIQNIGDKDKKIELVVYKKMNYLVVKCSNTISSKKKINKGKDHGYGLKIVQDIANKYNGEVNIEKSKNLFEIVVLLAEE